MAHRLPEHSFDEQEAASAVMSLKRTLETTAASDLCEAARPIKLLKRTVSASDDSTVNSASRSDPSPPLAARKSKSKSAEAPPRQRELLPAPFYYYRDHSRDEDDDPLAPLTPPSRVPTFPAKMHAILSDPSLEDVAVWLPHGRSWRIVDSAAFEKRVLPEYFDHRKFSSFIRQANGWGFRRVTTGCDRNTYYHELFLRGMPHLCKKMKRPGAAKKMMGDPDHEPNFYEISRLYPVPEAKTGNDSAGLLPRALGIGPEARKAARQGIAGDRPRPRCVPKPVTPPLVSMAPPPVPGVAHPGVRVMVTPPRAASPPQSLPQMQKPAVTPPMRKPTIHVPQAAAAQFIAQVTVLQQAQEAQRAQQQRQAAAAAAAAAAGEAQLKVQQALALVLGSAKLTSPVPASPVPEVSQDPVTASAFAAGFAAARALNKQAQKHQLQQQQQQQQHMLSALLGLVAAAGLGKND